VAGGGFGLSRPSAQSAMPDYRTREDALADEARAAAYTAEVAQGERERLATYTAPVRLSPPTVPPPLAPWWAVPWWQWAMSAGLALVIGLWPKGGR